MAECIEWPSPVLGDRGILTSRVQSLVKLTDDFKIDTYRFLAKRSALLGHVNRWLAQGQINVTEWDLGAGSLVFQCDNTIKSS